MRHRVAKTEIGGRGLEWPPAEGETLATFVDKQGRTPSIATIERRIAAIKFAHRMLDLPSPTEKAMSASFRGAAHMRTSRPKQSLGLTFKISAQVIAACLGTLTGKS